MKPPFEHTRNIDEDIEQCTLHGRSIWKVSLGRIGKDRARANCTVYEMPGGGAYTVMYFGVRGSKDGVEKLIEFMRASHKELSK